MITDINLIPLSSQQEAKQTIAQAKDRLKSVPTRTNGGTSDNDVSEDDEEGIKGQDDDDHDQVLPPLIDDPASQGRPAGPNRSASNVAEDVIGRKGQYGRFAERWFSKKGWTSERRKTLGMSADDGLQSPSAMEQVNVEGTQQPDILSASNNPEAGIRNPSGSKSEDTAVSPSGVKQLLPKLLRTTRMLLTSNSFFYSYDMDITRRLGTTPSKSSDLPLHKSVDPLVSHSRMSYD